RRQPDLRYSSACHQYSMEVRDFCGECTYAGPTSGNQTYASWRNPRACALLNSILRNRENKNRSDQEPVGDRYQKNTVHERDASYDEAVNKRFRVCDLNQPFLVPPSLQDWLPEDHLAR